MVRYRLSRTEIRGNLAQSDVPRQDSVTAFGPAVGEAQPSPKGLHGRSEVQRPATPCGGPTGVSEGPGVHALLGRGDHDGC